MTILDIFLFVLFVWSVYNLYSNRQINLQTHAVQYVIPVKVQHEKDQVYIWNASTEEFIAQGKDINEAMEKCHLRFPNQQFEVIEEDETTKR